MKRFFLFVFAFAAGYAADPRPNILIANAGSTGTTLSKLAKLTGAPSTAVIAGTSDTGGVVGIVIGGAGTTGSATIQLNGRASCIFDGATTAGHYVQISSSTAGDCHDSGASYPTSGQVLGRVLSTNGAGGTYSMDLFPAEILPGGSTNQNIRTIGAAFGSFESGATALSGSKTGCVPVYFAGTIQAVKIIGNVSGSATIDVLTVAHGSWTGTASATSITASAVPALSSAAAYTDSTLTGWTTALAADTDVCFAMTSPTTVAGLEITLKVKATQ